MAFIRTICESLALKPVQVDTVYGQTVAITCEMNSGQGKVRLLVFSVRLEREKEGLRGRLDILRGMEGREGVLRVREVAGFETAEKLAAVVDWTDMNLATDIESRRQQNYPYPESQILLIAYTVLKALSALQATALGPLAVSPANIFVTEAGEVLLFPIEMHAENLAIGRNREVREDLLGLGLTLWCMVDLKTSRSEVEGEGLETLKRRISPSLFAIIQGAIRGLEESQLLAQLEAAIHLVQDI